MRDQYSFDGYLKQGSGGTPASPSPTVVFETTSKDNERWQGNTSQKRKRPKDLLANMTSYGVYDNRTWNTVCKLDYGNFGPIQGYISVGTGSDSIVNAGLQSANNAAISRLYADLKNETWNAAVFFAELGKTTRFFAESAMHLLHAYRLARRGDFLGLSELYQRYDPFGNKRKPAYKRVANIWLQWRYAVRPVVADIQAMLLEYSQSTVNPVVKRITASATEDVGMSQPSVINGHPALKYRSGKVTVRYVAYYTCTLDDAAWKRMGLWNGLSVLWELTPYSFMVDKVLPIGQYISNLDAAAGVTFKGLCKVEKRSWDAYARYRSGESHAQVREYSRTPVASLPSLPLPSWKKPGDPGSSLVDVLALLSQLRR